MEADPYTRLAVRELYRNPWLAVEAHEIVHPTGESGEHLLVVIPQACGVVVEDGGELVFARQPRFGARKAVVEIVKGGRDVGESPLDCARRELREELGILAADWSDLGRLYEIPSIVSQPLSIFVARDLQYQAPDPEAQESIEIVRLRVDAALDAAFGGEIDDAVTVAALFRYAMAGGFLARSS